MQVAVIPPGIHAACIDKYDSPEAIWQALKGVSFSCRHAAMRAPVRRDCSCVTSRPLPDAPGFRGHRVYMCVCARACCAVLVGASGLPPAHMAVLVYLLAFLREMLLHSPRDITAERLALLERPWPRLMPCFSSVFRASCLALACARALPLLHPLPPAPRRSLPPYRGCCLPCLEAGARELGALRWPGDLCAACAAAASPAAAAAPYATFPPCPDACARPNARTHFRPPRPRVPPLKQPCPGVGLRLDAAGARYRPGPRS